MIKKYHPYVLFKFFVNVFKCWRLIGGPLLAYRFLRRNLSPYIGCFSFGGMRFKGRKEDWVAINEVLIKDEYACIEKILVSFKSPFVLDLGANIGCFALRVFKQTPLAEIVSIEAANDTFQILKENTQLNSNLNWQSYNLGVWSHDGPVSLLRKNNAIGHCVIQTGGDDQVNGISLISLMKLIERDSIDLLKIDIEGGEEVVIPSSVSILKKTRYLIIEVHNDRFDPSEVMSVLSNVYTNMILLNDRSSKKPVFVMSNEPLNF